MASSPTLLFLGLPPKTFLGLDLLSFNSSPNFHGITNLPSGFHFLYTGTDASLAIRHGRWLKIPTSPTNTPVYTFEWSSDNESLTLLPDSSSKAIAAARAIPDLRARGLVDFHALEDSTSDLQQKQTQTTPDATPSSPADWPLLTSHLTPTLLTRVLTSSWTVSSISSAPVDTESIPGLTQLESSSVLHNATLNVAEIDLKQTWPDGAVGRERTDKARDRSWYLGQLVEKIAGDRDKGKEVGAKELLGEVQLCFLMVLTLANYSCLEQWKRILGVLFTCRQAVGEVEGFFVEVVKVLRGQLGHVEDVEGGLFEMSEENGSTWLKRGLARFRVNVEEVLGGQGKRSKLGEELEGLEEFMREQYDWEYGKDVLRRGMLELEDGERVEVSMDGVDEDEETGEYAPLVVET